jgi:hypothetical protein
MKYFYSLFMFFFFFCNLFGKYLNFKVAPNSQLKICIFANTNFHIQTKLTNMLIVLKCCGCRT